MKPRILIVDDELSMREFLSILLELEGYEVLTAADAALAQERLASSRIDLVISDVQMPGLNGIELLAWIKKETPDTAVLLITAFSTAEQAVEAMKLGAYDYLAKPFKVEEIKILVRNALENRTCGGKTGYCVRRPVSVMGLPALSAGRHVCGSCLICCTRLWKHPAPYSSPVKAVQAKSWPPVPYITEALEKTSHSWRSTAELSPKT